MYDKATDLMITPDTRVAGLLDKFPQLEETLIAMSPQFAKLRNPILRRTVAKVATLQQIARVGGIPLGEVINRLRQAAGVAGGWREETSQTDADAPSWMANAAIVTSFDARPILDAGEHPMGQVLGDLKLLKPGEVYEFITPFVPAPLIDMIRGKGYVVWSRQSEPGAYRNYVTMAP